MKIKAQMAMVMNLDKCIGCHTCSIPCKHVWTSRRGTEYMWYNDVETKPGVGYPRRWEDQEHFRGGWVLKNGKLTLAAGGRIEKFLKIFHNPDLPHLDDYYEPFTYTYESLVKSPPVKHQPVARPKSMITDDYMQIDWGPNWEDDLAGVNTTGRDDVNFKNLDHEMYLRFQNVFMFYLPRICEHCLNPSCVGSCPSGALYKRSEDGIVLVDQERCRGWRYCVSGCPYKKVYFNWASGRSEKCIFCYPRIEAGLPTMCAESCVGRIRYVGVLLYDAERIKQAASTEDDRGIYAAHLSMFMNPNDPEVIASALENGVSKNFIAAAQQSPVYKLAVDWKLAFPPHPEFRTLPMVWYVPPLSPIIHYAEQEKGGTEDIDSMRIPVAYLANLLAAGDEAPVRLALKRLVALRWYMRSRRVEGKPNLAVLQEADMTDSMADDMYRLLAIAKYQDRYVIPTVTRELAEDLEETRTKTGFLEVNAPSFEEMT